MSLLEIMTLVGFWLAIVFLIPPLAYLLVFRVLFGAPCDSEARKA